MASPFDLSRTLPVGGGFLAPCSLPGRPVIKQLSEMVTIVPVQGGRFQSVRVSKQSEWNQISAIESWPLC